MSISAEDRSHILQTIAERRLALEQAKTEIGDCANSLLGLFLVKEMDWVKLNDVVTKAKELHSDIDRLEDRIGMAEAYLLAEDEAEIMEFQESIAVSAKG